MELCPGTICIRRTTTSGTEKIDVTPVFDLAFIEKLVVEINEPVNIRYLGFHVKDTIYCNSLKNQNADKHFCMDFKAKPKYVHFEIIKEGYPPEKSLFLIAFLPRSKSENELNHVAEELCGIIEWLGVLQPVNCIIFRYGSPVHRKNSLTQWQRSLDNAIKGTKGLYTVGQITGRIRHISENVQKNKARHLTISPASPFESINVS